MGAGRGPNRPLPGSGRACGQARKACHNRQGIGLEDAGIVGQMRLGMLTGPIARVIEHRPPDPKWFEVRKVGKKGSQVIYSSKGKP
jgi:hypothetical protein